MYLLASAPNTITRSPATSFPERRNRSSATQIAALPRLPSADASQMTRDGGTFQRACSDLGHAAVGGMNNPPVNADRFDACFASDA